MDCNVVLELNFVLIEVTVCNSVAIINISTNYIEKYANP